MRNDEFNQNKYTNDQQLKRAEYGRTQHNEFSDSGEMGLKRSSYNSNLNQTVQNASKETFVEAQSASTSASASSAGATAYVAGTSGAASSIAATTSSVVVAASSVAVTAISVVTGVSVALHDYKCDFDSLFISSNRIDYQLTIADSNNQQQDKDYEYDMEAYEDQQFSIRLFNSGFESKTYLHYGTSSGSFENLTLGETYNIVVTADTVTGNKVLYQNQITTAATARFLDFEIDPNYRDFDDILFVDLDYVDDLDCLSDFNLSLTRKSEKDPDMPEEFEEEGFTANYPLIKQLGRQSVKIAEQDMWIEPTFPYQYEFSYVRNNERVVFEDGEIYFNTDYEGYSEVYGIYFYNEINSDNNTFSLYINYVDERNLFSEFVLHLRSGADTIDIPLEETSDTQVFSLEEYGLEIETEYEVTLTYKSLEEEKTLQLEPLTLIDPNKPVSEFYDVFFNGKMNYETGDFNVTLYYRDDFDYFDNFSINFVNDEKKFDITIPLDKTLEGQVFNGFSYGFEPETEYTYTVSYYNQSELVTTEPITFTFEDVYGRVSEFNEFIFDKTGNFLTNEFNLRLDFTDPFNFFTDFTFSLSEKFDEAEAPRVVEIPLQQTTQVQTIKTEDYDIQLRNHTFTYELTCRYRGALKTLSSGPVTFTDNSGAVSKFNQFIFDGTANQLTNEVTFQLDYVDDFDIFYNFVVIFHDNDLGDDIEIELEKTTEQQTFDMIEYGLYFDTSYTYTLTVNEEGETKVLATDTFTFTDNSGAVSEFSGLSFVNGEANYQTRSFQVQLNYQDDFDVFDNFVLEIRDYQTNNSSSYNLRKTTDPQTITIDENTWDSDLMEYVYPIDILNHTIVYSVYYTDSRNGDTPIYKVSEEPISFANSLHTVFNDIICPGDMIQDSNYPDSYIIPIKLDYNDEARIYGTMYIELLDGNDVIGQLSYANEVTPQVGTWLNTNLSLMDMDVEEFIGNTYTVRVVSQILDEKNHDNTVEIDRVIFSKDVTFNVVNEPVVYGVTTDGTIFGTEAYFIPYFSLTPESYSECQIIIETYDGQILTYNITLENYGWTMTVSIFDPNEKTLSDADVSDLFVDHDVNISFSYRTVTTVNDSGTGETQVFSDPIVIVLYTNYRFELSV